MQEASRGTKKRIKKEKMGGKNKEIAAAWHQRLGAEFFFFLYFLTGIYFSNFLFVIS